MAVTRATPRGPSGRFGNLMVYALLGLGVLVWMAPLAWMISTSLKPEADVLRLPPAWVPNTVSFDNYLSVIQKSQLPRWFLNSLVVASFTTLLVLLVDAPAAYAFARFQFPGRHVLFLLILATIMVPSQVLYVPLYLLLNDFDLINTYPALILPRVALPLGVFLLRQFFLGLPRELEEAARIDGAGRWTIFWRIALPLTVPALSALAIVSFLGSWNNFLWPLIATSREVMFTLPVGLANFQGTYGPEYGRLMAAASLATLPVLVVFLIFQRQFIQSVALSGIKG